MSDSGNRRARQTRARSVQYPLAPRQRHVDVVHEVRVPDPYRWLENAVSWLNGQQQLLEGERRRWRRREALCAELDRIARVSYVGDPMWRGARRFLTRRRPEHDQPILCTVGADGVERVLIDPNALDVSGATVLDDWFPSIEGELVAYRLSRGGNEESDIHVIDVESGEVVDGPIPRARSSSVAWLPNGMGVYYQRRLAPDGLPETERQHHRRVWLHRLGTPETADQVVCGEGMVMTNWYTPSVSRDGRWLIVSVSSGAGARRNDLL